MKALFVGKGVGSPTHYRIRLPAEALGHDWSAVQGEPPGLHWRSGNPPEPVQLDEYETVVLQQPATLSWVPEIERLRALGIRVLFEIDDYLHGVPRVRGHQFAEHFDRDVLSALESCMSACDGLIVTTEFLAGKYRRFARDERVYVCPNGLDLARFDVTKPINLGLKPRDGQGMRTKNSTVVIGWSGGTGHLEPMEVWLSAVHAVMSRNQNVNFVSIGRPFADSLEKHFPGRSLSVPFSAIDQYPAAMTMLDIALAPSGKGAWARAHSDLRWLEASALGIPVVADPLVYPRIEHNRTGLLVEDGRQLEVALEGLAMKPKERERIGGAAREWVREHASIEVTAQAWGPALSG